MAPKGRTRKETPKTAKVARMPARGSSEGKNYAAITVAR
jgi:hypothetical protein